MQQKHAASFRDPSGFIFREKGIVYRQVNKIFKENYDFLMSSGLYKELVGRGMLIPHEESSDVSGTAQAYKIIRPEAIRFISYPYEWCFAGLKDAAMLTLEIQRTAMKFGMSLRDASAYNIQFHNGRLTLIDTLSFEKYDKRKPWSAYGQFCRHFLAPLALASFRDPRLIQMLRIYIDGIPLDLASKLLPFRTNFKSGILFHIHAHAKSEKRFSGATVAASSTNALDASALFGILKSLEQAIRPLDVHGAHGVWHDRGEVPAQHLIESLLADIRPKTLWDLSGNGGLYARLAGALGIRTVAFDGDERAVQEMYVGCRKSHDKNILPLVLDLANPSPALGWANEERASLRERGPADMVLAMDLLHRLAIGNNLPFESIASFFAEICTTLVIEFVPKDDARAARLLQNRPDIFSSYSQENFEKEFGNFFTIKKHLEIPGTRAVVYLMEKK
ncbi:MAG: SAM-dependent methyltransferase [bacterium]|nr:SAM-dependent methyltransferase [bacterium]